MDHDAIIERTLARLDHLEELMDSIKQSMQAAQFRLRVAEQKAERYEWLKNQISLALVKDGGVGCGSLSFTFPCQGALPGVDSAIDSAIDSSSKRKVNA